MCLLSQLCQEAEFVGLLEPRVRDQECGTEAAGVVFGVKTQRGGARGTGV